MRQSNVNRHNGRIQKAQGMELGRSMVEMLGVLAIIGILSVMGIAGYTIAMRKYRANEIAQSAAMLNMLAAAREDCLTLSAAGMPTSIAGLSVDMKSDNGSITDNHDVQVCLTGDSVALCDAIVATEGLTITCGSGTDCSCED